MEIYNQCISILLVVIVGLFLIIEKKKKIKIKEIDLEQFISVHQKKIFVLFLILILISRFYKFGSLPTAVSVDEAAAAYDSYCIANYGMDRHMNSFPIYLLNYGGGQSVLYAYLNVLLMKVTGISGNSILLSRLPALLLFLMSIIIGYKLVEKKQDKKTAVLFAFLIIISQWQIIQSRFGLDCNLLGPLFILDLYFLETARKNYQYAFAGISIGITLYTYSISWIIMPVFLLTWIIYSLYVKKVKIVSHIIIMCIIILLFALPLIYFLLVNTGHVERIKIGIFTFPKMLEWRAGEISANNILKYGAISIKRIFASVNTIYYFEIPFFIIGIIQGIKNTIKSISKKEYSLTATITLSFIVIFITNLCIYIEKSNRANILYIPILYFVTIGIMQIVKNRRTLWIIIITIYIALFTGFELYYYSYYSKQIDIFSDNSIIPMVNYLEENGIDGKEVYVYNAILNMPIYSSNYIYYCFCKKISPYIYHNTFETNTKTEQNYLWEKAKVDKYYFNYFDTEIEYYNKDRVYIIDDYFSEYIEKLKNTEYEEKVFMKYHIFYNK